MHVQTRSRAAGRRQKSPAPDESRSSSPGEDSDLAPGRFALIVAVALAPVLVLVLLGSFG